MDARAPCLISSMRQCVCVCVCVCLALGRVRRSSSKIKMFEKCNRGSETVIIIFHFLTADQTGPDNGSRAIIFI